MRGGRLTLADTAKLLRLRGQAMQQAVPAGEGAMAAILGLDFAKVSHIAHTAARDLYLTAAICEAANDNGGGQVVISGTKAAVERAMELAKAAGRQAGAAARRLRAVPLRADDPGRRSHGQGAGRNAESRRRACR